MEYQGKKLRTAPEKGNCWYSQNLKIGAVFCNNKGINPLQLSDNIARKLFGREKHLECEYAATKCEYAAMFFFGIIGYNQGNPIPGTTGPVPLGVSL